ncbi:MAG: radical SAM protein [Chitinivibrionales bacterium]|nr:radical SAM protein [Chitinivibrionales bacterium]
MHTQDILKKSCDAEALSKEELIHLLGRREDSVETYLVMSEANRISKELTDGKAEVHAQFALNLAPCTCNCLFCSFAQNNGIFSAEIRLTPEQAVAYARQLEQSGANALFIMSTAQYPFELFMEMIREIKPHLKPETKLIANVGDQSLTNAKRLKDAGFVGVYHALRLREGVDTTLSPERRKKSIRNFQEAGLSVGTCVEPVGPEHTPEELADMILFTASFNPSYSGAARRIAIPGTEMEKRGMISELRMAQIVAITRLAMPLSVPGNCTHEPCTLGALAGANLFWAELGANPRDVEARTEDGRGDTVEHCRRLYHEAGWEVWDRQTRYCAQPETAASQRDAPQ